MMTVARVRQQLIEEGVDGVLTPKRSPNSARPRIFDGASEAKLIALACSTPPEGYARPGEDTGTRTTKAGWRFTTENARIRLKHLYPTS